MTELLSNFFARVFGDNVELATILISMIPIIELRGAIPFATNSDLWKTSTLTNWQAFGWSLLGSSIIVPIVAVIFKPIIAWLKKTKLFGRLAKGIENRVRNKAESMSNTNEQSKRFSPSYWKKVLATFIFVAIPLPLTGVWTGTCVAVFLGLDYITTCTTVITGNIIAGLIITLILQFFPWLNNYLLWIFLALVAVFIIFEIVKSKIKNKKNAKQIETDNSTQDK